MITGANAPAGSARAAAAAAVAACTLLALQLIVLGGRAQIFGDFHAFYCGGAAVLHGLNPYAAASIARCEALAQPFGLHHTAGGVTAPVPFPGYAFALFAPFALLPYVASSLLWLVLLLVTGAASAVLLSRLSSVPLWIALTITGSAYAIAVTALGEVASIALAAVCAAALALRAQRFWLCALWLSVAAILPHVLLPALVAVMLFSPRSRLPLLVCGAALLALDVALTGRVAALEYFTGVLPAHARSEIGYIAQYGLTWMAHAAGAGDRAALALGNLGYAAAAVAGIACAAVLARRRRDAAMLVAIPCAFSVAGGPFMHYSEITLAFPAALLLYAHSLPPARAWYVAAVMLLCVPWQWMIGEPLLAVPAGLLTVYAAASGLMRSADAGLRSAAAALLYACALLVIAVLFGPQVQHLGGGASSGALAQSAWAHYIRTQGASGGAVWWLAKAPTWLGLAALTACGAYAAAKKDLVTAALIDRAPAGL
ncbi:MAG: glycosyltransferase 87 family protein [Candidatus Baltobacteraceae bacterium]